MRISFSKLLSVVIAFIAIGAFSFSIAPGQLVDGAGSAIPTSVVCQTSDVYSSDSYKSADSGSFNEQEAIESLLSVARKSKMSILDALEDVFGQAKDKVGEVADAVTGAKDEAARRFSEWQEEREKAAREREQAKARAMKVLEEAKLNVKRDTLKCSAKRADPLKLVECSDPKVEVSADGMVDRSKPGARKVTYTLSYDGQSMKHEVSFKVCDTKPPKINLVDTAPKVEVGDAYKPARNVKQVKDAVDGELTRVKKAPKAKGKKAGAEVFYDEGWYTVKGKVDTTKAGVYPVEVVASDVYGNTANCSFDVTVEEPEPKPAPEPEPEVAEAAMMMRSIPSQTVYWTPSGEVYHHSMGCPSLSRSKVIYSGTIEESGKSRACKRC